LELQLPKQLLTREMVLAMDEAKPLILLGVALGVTLQLHQVLFFATKSALQLHQILRLPRNCKFKILSKNPLIASGHELVISHPPVRGAYVPSWRGILYGEYRLSPKLSPNAPSASKSDTPTSPKWCPCCQNQHSNITATSPNIAGATKSDTPTSPNVAPATPTTN